jgi:hypothetical protein
MRPPASRSAARPVSGERFRSLDQRLSGIQRRAHRPKSAPQRVRLLGGGVLHPREPLRQCRSRHSRRKVAPYGRCRRLEELLDDRALARRQWDVRGSVTSVRSCSFAMTGSYRASGHTRTYEQRFGAQIAPLRQNGQSEPCPHVLTHVQRRPSGRARLSLVSLSSGEVSDAAGSAREMSPERLRTSPRKTLQPPAIRGTRCTSLSARSG